MKTLLRLVSLAALMVLPLGGQTIIQNMQAPSGQYVDNSVPRRDGTANRFQTSDILFNDVVAAVAGIASTTGNDLRLLGTNGIVYLNTGGTDRWVVNASGAFNPIVNNTYDIGNGTVNPRDVHASRKFSAGDGLVGTPSYSFTSNTDTGMYIGGSEISFARDGVRNFQLQANGQFFGAGAGSITLGTDASVVLAAAGTNIPITITASGTAGAVIKGTGTNDAAAAGKVGELLSAQLAAASTTSLVTATGKTVISLSLTAGDWEVSGTVHFVPANTTVVASLIASVSATDNTQASVDSVGGYASIGAVYTSAGATMSATPIPVRVSLASTTTYYLVATGTFTISTCTSFGTLRARRLR